MNWNDIDRVPSSQNEIMQDKQMESMPAASNNGQIDQQDENNMNTLNDRLEMNTHKSPIIPM